MTHAESQTLLLDLAYGELDPAHAAALDEHLAGCAECRAERAQLEATRTMVSPLREEEQPSRGFDEPILAAARAEASLQSDGTPGQVIEVAGSVVAAGVEPARIDATAPVRAQQRARRPRWALRVALGGSAAAAATLAILASTGVNRHEPQVATEKAYEIHITAPQLAREGAGAAREEASRAADRAAPPAAAEKTAASPEPAAGAPPAGTSAPAAAASAPPAAASAPPSAAPPPRAAPPPAATRAPPEPAEAQLAKQARPTPLGLRGGGGGDVSDQPGRGVGAIAGNAGAAGAAGAASAAQGALAEAGAASPARESPHATRGRAESPAQKVGATGSRAAPPGPAAPSPEAAPFKSAAPPAQAAASRPAPPPPPVAVAQATKPQASPALDAAPAVRAMAAEKAERRVAAADDLSADALEDSARKSRRESNYALAAAQYRKAAALRRAAAPADATAAWDLAHAVECLSAVSQFAEAQGVWTELRTLYPAESSASAAAERALRPGMLAPSTGPRQ